MLRTNLATRPFYNERAVQILLVAAAALVLALTIFNVVTVVSLSRRNTELSTTIANDHAEADRLTREAQRIRAGMNQAELKAVVAAAAEANALIDQRTFSWTEFFNHIEATLPPDVMITAVQPGFDRNQTIVSMTVLGRTTDVIDEFIEKLEATGAFENALPAQGDRTEEGLQRSLIRAVYTGVAAEPEAAAQAAPAAAPAAPQTGGARR